MSNNSSQVPTKDGRQMLSEKVAHVSSYHDDVASSLNKERKSSTS